MNNNIDGLIDLTNIQDDNALNIILELQKKLNTSEINRKLVHNQLQDLKGNVRVYVRCRPYLPIDGGEYNDNSCNSSCNSRIVNCVDDSTVILNENIDGNNNSNSNNNN